MLSISVVLQLNRNDEINVYNYHKFSKLRDASQHRFTHFMGYLLKQDVGFDCQKSERYTNTSGIITYDTATPNHGNGIVTSTGIFTAPKPGIYAFHFHAQAKEKSTNINVRHNNVQVADLLEGSTSPNTIDQMVSMSVVLKLEKNDQVDV